MMISTVHKADPGYVLCVPPKTPGARKPADSAVCLPGMNAKSPGISSGKGTIFANTAVPQPSILNPPSLIRRKEPWQKRHAKQHFPIGESRASGI